MKRERLIIFLVVLLQVFTIFLVARQKEGFHIDENYSYILSNSYDSDRISHADWMWGDWVDGDEFDEFLTVQDDERFAYASVYYNNSLDGSFPNFV